MHVETQLSLFWNSFTLGIRNCKNPGGLVNKFQSSLPAFTSDLAALVIRKHTVHNLQGYGERKKDWDALVHWASESSVFLVPLNSTVPLGKLETTERTNVLYCLCRNMYRWVTLYALNFEQVNTNSHLTHRQNNLSWTSGHYFWLLVTIYM